MPAFLEIALRLAENAALLALGVLGYCQLKDRIHDRLRDDVASLLYGLLFGLMGVLSIAASIDAGSGVRLDLRNAMVVTATLLSGVPAGALATAIVSLYRWTLGGGGAPAGIVGILISFGLSALYLTISPRRECTLHWRGVAVAAGAAISGGIGVTALFPTPEAVRFALYSVAPAWLMATPLTILFLAATACHFERRRALVRALAEREGELEAILENAPLPIFFKDRDGRFRLVNRCYQDWFRKAAADVMGRTVAELYPVRTPQIVEDSDRVAMEHGTVTYLRDGIEYAALGIQTMQITKFPIRDRAGQLIGIGGFAVDMTEMRRSETALRENEARYRALIEHSNDIVAVVDRRGLIGYRNSPEPDPLGYTADEKIGQSLLDFVHPDDAAEISSSLQAIARMPAAHTNGITRYRHKDGSWRQIAWSARNALDVPGITGIIINARDVTAIKDLEAQLLQARKMEAIGRLAGGIAHDFNNILGSILGFAGFLLEDLPQGSPQYGFASRIHCASERARDLVQQIVAFSRMSSVERVPCDLIRIIQDTRELLRPVLPSSTDITIDHESAQLIAEVNAAQMGQILVNLCVNANDALAGEPGRIAISSTTIAPGHADYALFADESDRAASPEGCFRTGSLDPWQPYLRISIADTGHGMRPDQLERAFEPFYTTKERGRGTGLGLAVVHGIVMSYEGALSVTSRPEGGTVFRIYLPLLEAAGLEVEHPATVAPPEFGGRERILIGDDEAMIAEMLGVGLGRLGYRVESRNDPQEALRLFADDPGRWDVVISDEVMPRMRGSLLFEKLKAIDPSLRFILCTGFSDEVTDETFRAAGIDAFFHKPASPEQLGAAIRRLVGFDDEDPRRPSIPVPVPAIP